MQDDLNLAKFLAVSLVMHAALVFGFGSGPSPAVRAKPLQVDIRYLSFPAIHEPAADLVQVPLDALPEAGDHSRMDQIRESAAMAATLPAAPQTAVQSGSQPDTYFSARDVDVRAAQLNEVDLIYPLEPYNQRIHGRLVIDLYINNAGALDKVVVIDAAPPGLFEEAALKAVNELKFSPALKNGLKVKSRKTIEVKFDPYEKIAVP